MAVDSETTNKVLEALSLQMQQTSMAKEITSIEEKLQSLIKQKAELENAKRQYLTAQAGVARAAETAKQMALDAEKRAKEVMVVAERAIAAWKEADKFVAMVKKPLNFDAPITEVGQEIGRADAAKKQLNAKLNEVKARRESLKKEGIDINLDGTPRMPTRVTI